MKKLILITGIIAGTLLMSCRATVKTPKTTTDVKVGSSIQQVHPVQ
jgi:hypothetical protein